MPLALSLLAVAFATVAIVAEVPTRLPLDLAASAHHCGQPDWTRTALVKAVAIGISGALLGLAAYFGGLL